MKYFKPLYAPKKHMTIILKWVLDIKMFSMLPIPNFVLPNLPLQL